MLRNTIVFAGALAGLVLACPSLAKVQEASANGFVLRHGVDVPASPAETWRTLIAPSQWWSPNHSFSGDAANLTLDARAGGCFCEVLPNVQSPKAAPRGSVEHMHVIYVEEPRALRMRGALGPLQAGAAGGTLTIMLQPQGSGTRILWEYVVGGYMPGDPTGAANAADAMLGVQLSRLARKLGAKDAPQPKSSMGKGDDDFGRIMSGGLDPNLAQDSPVIEPAPDVFHEPSGKSDERVIIGR